MYDCIFYSHPLARNIQAIKPVNIIQNMMTVHHQIRQENLFPLPVRTMRDIRYGFSKDTQSAFLGRDDGTPCRIIYKSRKNGEIAVIKIN